MDMNYSTTSRPAAAVSELRHRHEQRQPAAVRRPARPSIDVFDTFDGGQLLNAGVPVTIPIRDPIIGPFRVARAIDPVTLLPIQLLFGITANGLVMVRLRRSRTRTRLRPDGDSSPPGPLSTRWKGGRLEQISRARPGVGLRVLLSGSMRAR